MNEALHGLIPKGRAVYVSCDSSLTRQGANVRIVRSSPGLYYVWADCRQIPVCAGELNLLKTGSLVESAGSFAEALRLATRFVEWLRYAEQRQLSARQIVEDQPTESPG